MEYKSHIISGIIGGLGSIFFLGLIGVSLKKLKKS